MLEMFFIEGGNDNMKKENTYAELETVFKQTYDGTVKRDSLANAALSFEKEFQAEYFSRMDIFMRSQNAYEVFRVDD